MFGNVTVTPNPPQMHGDMLLTTLKCSKQEHGMNGEDTQIHCVKPNEVLVNGTQNQRTKNVHCRWSQEADLILFQVLPSSYLF